MSISVASARKPRVPKLAAFGGEPRAMPPPGQRALIPDWLPAPISRSWQRCHALGLQAEQPPEMDGPEDYAIRQMRERQQSLVAAAEAELRPMASALADTAHLAFVVDAQGFVLAIEGDRAQAGAILGKLRFGVNLSEAQFGTNAAGTALVERAPTLVRRGEHFHAQLNVLDCFASPIVSPGGELLGALTVSSQLAPQLPGVPELTQVAVARLEHRLVCALDSPLLVRLHPHAEGIGSAAEGLLAISDDGEILGMSSAAARMLGCDARSLIGKGMDSVFDCPALHLLSRTGNVCVLRVHKGLGISARMVRNARPAQARRTRQAASTPAPQAGSRMAPSEALSERELRVVQELETGISNAEIAQRLYISNDAVKYHLKNIFAKLGASSRCEAVRICRELRMLS